MSYCDWDKSSTVCLRYHDTEWGVPLHDDRRQFEFIAMEVMQCGLNWDMMMNKREIFRVCFDNFDFEKISKYGETDIARIMNVPGMIRSRKKIEAIINNAQCYKRIRDAYGSFSKYLWSYTNNKTIIYNKHSIGYIPTSNGLSETISKDLKKYGFKYLGPVVIYSHLQACGIINDHDKNCECFSKINAISDIVYKKRFLERNIRYYGIDINC